MANPLMKMKLPKLLAREFDDVQGALSDGIQVVERIRQAGVDLNVSLPLMEAVQRMMNEAADRGLQDKDFVVASEAYLPKGD